MSTLPCVSCPVPVPVPVLFVFLVPLLHFIFDLLVLVLVLVFVLPGIMLLYFERVALSGSNAGNGLVRLRL